MIVTITFRGRSNCQCYIKDIPHTNSEGGSYGRYTYEYNRNTLDKIHLKSRSATHVGQVICRSVESVVYGVTSL